MRIGSLCSGYGGLEMGIQAVYGGTTAWVSDIDKGACKILAHRYPTVPNIGDMTTVDWATVEPVDVICGGTPCQDLSHAGRRAGMTEGTRSNLWVAMREAIATIRPRLVVWENVGGAASAAADSAVERCAGCVGDGPGVHLRALGRVVGDLSSLGYVGSLRAIRASDVGAPHGRLRYFLAATDAEHREGGVGHDPDLLGRRAAEAEQAGVGNRGTVTLLAAPQSRDYKGVPGDGFNTACLARDVSLLPTPAVNDMGEGKTVERWDEWTADMQAKHGNGNGHGKSLAIEAQRLLPTPTTRDHKDHMIRREPHRPEALDTLSRALTRWGDYAAAIERWEHTLGRPAPAPTTRDWERWEKRKARRLASRLPVGMRGSIDFIVAGPAPQLSARFVEWMMGLPAGWVTDVPGITRNEALKALGNGVVPQQAAEALRVMASWELVP